NHGGDPHDALRAISRLAAACRPGDELVVYFSGHGVLLGGRLFLLWDTTSERIFDSALNAKHILETLDLSIAAHKLLILDCCHAAGAVGFKGGDLQPVLTEAGSQLVICASARLELAREFDEFCGSFIAHHTLDVLGSPTKRSVLL